MKYRLNFYLRNIYSERGGKYGIVFSRLYIDFISSVNMGLILFFFKIDGKLFIMKLERIIVLGFFFRFIF